ncbi:MAG: hypothetical protein C0190_01605 [Thermodesulfobacterium geofontis]|uniref:HDOD domain-containing protein n=1 Tax=Thermodesulfobacterium geofontis TaxID=1295609 RepID=A0A2N7PPR2_9BACT|nr:MAG: hypothetical protein C0190_01605 [Thermodesulfobacterium geofontis]
MYKIFEACQFSCFWLFQKDYEDHSIRVGTGARIIAEMGELKNVSEVAIAGIVHDLGKTVIADFLLKRVHLGRK